MIEQQLHVAPVTGGGVAFLGEVPVTELISGDALATAIGLTAGTAQFSNEPWLKFNLDGKTLFVAKKTYRHSVSWDQLNARGAVYGTATVVLQGETYKVRLLKGSATDPYVGVAGGDLIGAYGSEWNRLFYPLVPNPTNAPTHPVSREGIQYGSFANYTEADLVIATGIGRRTWCQESDGSTCVYRGNSSVSHLGLATSSTAASTYGWRPVLELVK